MKKTLLFLPFVCLCILFLALTADADVERRAYVICEEDGEYTLSEYLSGSPVALMRGSLSEIFLYIGDSGTYAELMLDGITLSAPLELPSGEYTLTGEVTITQRGRLIISEGTSLVMSELTLSCQSLSAAAVRIKGGELTVENSVITSVGCGAILLDYSDSSRFTLVSGTLSSSSDDPTVDIRNGRAALLAGKVDNSHAEAVGNDAGLFLSGEIIISGIGYDLKTEKPITLSYAGTPYSGVSPLRVCYLSSFARGSITEIFYSSSESSTEKIDLFDKDGREYQLSYFTECAYAAEKSFSAVYLPYTVRLYDGDGSIYTEYYLKGGKVSERIQSARVGYESSGWYTEQEGENKYSFDKEVSEDISLYAVYKLLPPKFAVSSVNTVYDGETHSLSFDSLTHPLLDSGGFFTYEWIKDGECISREASLSYSSVSNSGEYDCRITFHYNSDSSEALAEGIILTVDKRTVAIPTLPSVYYNGSSLTPTLDASSLYTAELPTGVLAGKYTVKFTLSDFENYKWDSCDTATAEAVFEILQAENRFTEQLSISDVYFGIAPTPHAYALFGDVSYIYSLSPSGEYSERAPTAPGSYYVRAIVEGTESYTSLASDPVAFSIMAERVSALAVSTPPSRTSYRAFDSFSPVGLSVTVSYNSGRSEEISSDKLSFTYQSGNSFMYGDSGIILSYGGVSTVLPLEISRADYDLSSLDTSPLTVTYDGSYHSYNRKLPDIVGKDGERLSVSIQGGGVNAGEYSVTLVFSSSSKNYNIPKNMTVKLVVNRYKTEILWESCDFVYNGEEQAPKATYIDVYGAKRSVSVRGSEINAGNSYAAAVDEIYGNYEFYNTECVFEIKKADYDLSGVYWSNSSFTYDNSEKSVYISGLPDGISVVGYTDAKATEAGEYIAVASIVYDTKNYNPPPSFSTAWKIMKAEYDMSSVHISSDSFVYDGNAHFPTVVGSMPIGLDGTSPTYAFSGSVTHVSEGEVAVKVEFSTESKNYNAPETFTVYLSVTPKPISVTWLSDTFVYDGKEHLPRAISGECRIDVSGGATDAGEYIALATPQSEDYSIINPEYPYVIEKAANSWLISPSIADVYEGDTICPLAEAYTGTPTVSFYSDLACEVKIETPTSHGKYYAVIAVEESKNYRELTGEVLEFSIIEVIPVRVSVEILAERPVAFYTLTPDDLLVTVSYNNGKSLTLHDLSELVVEYSNGDSLRRRDTQVSFSYRGLSAVAPIEVSRADYSPADFVWESKSFVYNGQSQHPTLTGLPKGVSVLEYVGVGCSAGKYTVVANISYDTENYNPPSAVSCAYTIERRAVEPEELPALVYNGKAQIPTATSSLYKLECIGECINAGEYTVVFTLNDKENYVFAGTDSHILTRTLEIAPKTLSAELSDLDVYLFDETEGLSYTFDTSSVIAGDTVDVSYYASGGKVYITSENPNYTFVFTPSELHRHNTLSEKARIRLFFFVLILLLLTLAIIVIVTQRDRIKGIYALVLCRYHNRNVNKHCHYMLKAEQNSQQSEYQPTQRSDENIADATRKTACSLDTAILSNPDSTLLSEPTVEKDEDDAKLDSDIQQPSESAVLAPLDVASNKDYDGYSTHIPILPEALPEAALSINTHEEISLSVDAEHADELITDSLAKDLVKKNREIVYTTGKGKGIINVDTLSENFTSGDRVDVNVLKEHRLVSQDTAYLKVLARGSIDKSLSVYANDFSLSAVKMICLTGGEAVKVTTVKERENKGKSEKSIEK